MTTRLPVVALPEPPGAPGPDAVLYLKPLIEAPHTDGVRRLARVEVLVREAARVTTSAIAVADLAGWMAGLPESHGCRAAGQLVALEATPLPFLGIATTGPLVMGIVNTTPDSFSDGGLAHAAADAEAQGRAMADAGASILDIGGESTRPGADPVPVADEMARVLPAIERLAGIRVSLSIDSRNAAVMAAALDAGAALVNDVSALTHDGASLDLVARREVPVVLMHALGDPRTMQKAPAYDHVSLDVFDYLEARIAACEAAGVARARIVVDPGIGFGKTLEHNLVLLRDLPLLRALGCPVLLGASRKKFIGRLSGVDAPARRGAGSVAAALAGARAGARILRVHDVADTLQALAVWRAIEGTGTT